MLPLKEATSEKHKRAERMPFNVRMFKGALSKQEYLVYLHQQLHLFQAIEETGLPHKDLARVKNVQSDMDELTSQGFQSNGLLDSTKTYAEYLRSLTYAQLLPHIYLNYMAIIFGGQMMRKSVPSTGRMYDFENMPELIQSIRSVQQDAWADEVNKGFDFVIAIFDELEAVSVKGMTV